MEVYLRSSVIRPSLLLCLLRPVYSCSCRALFLGFIVMFAAACVSPTKEKVSTENGGDSASTEVEEAEKPPPPPTPTALITPDQALKICPGMRVSNAPPATNRVINKYYPLILVQGVELMTAPLKGACLSSGFGKRGAAQKLHKGVDFSQRPAGIIYAAGAGEIRERVVRADFGNMILIDHGEGVYTRYAHLANFEPGTEVGSAVLMGSPLGTMGNTGHPPRVHLHYEILTGDYNNPKRSFGLTPRNPFKYPAR